METSTKIRSVVVFYIKFTHSYIQKTLLQELTDLLLREPVWLLAQTVAWPLLFSFSGNVIPWVKWPCSPSCSWLTAYKKSLGSGCRLHWSFAKNCVQLPLEWKPEQLHLGLWKPKGPSIFNNLPSLKRTPREQLTALHTSHCFPLCFTQWVELNTITEMSCVWWWHCQTHQL